MVFAHDTEVALAGAAALVNTDAVDTERLPDDAALDEFVRTWGWTGDRRHDRAELRAVRAAAPASAAASGRSTRTRSSGSSTHCCVRRGRCRSWSSTTSGTTTCTPPRPPRRWPPGWRSRRRWHSSTSSAAAS